MIQVFIVDDHEMFRQGLLRLLEAEPDIDVAGVSAGGDDTIAMLTRARPDIVLLDISMPHNNGYQIAEQIDRLPDDFRIIFLTMLESKIAFRTARNCEKMCGYVLKDCAFAELAAAIRAVAAGKCYYSKQIKPEKTMPVADCLTRRELEVLRVTAGGMTAAMAARKLGVSVKTIENHRWNIMRKLDAANMTAAITTAGKCGIL